MRIKIEWTKTKATEKTTLESLDLSLRTSFCLHVHIGGVTEHNKARQKGRNADRGYETCATLWGTLNLAAVVEVADADTDADA